MELQIEIPIPKLNPLKSQALMMAEAECRIVYVVNLTVVTVPLDKTLGRANKL